MSSDDRRLRTSPFDVTSQATVSGYRLAALAARAIPAPLARGVSPALGLGASMASPARRSQIERHLRRADPSLRGVRLRRAVHDAFESYARYWLESFRLPHLSARDVARGMRVDGFEHIEAALAAGRGVILALPHLGGWEWAGRWLVDRGLGVTVVVEAVEPPELFEWFVDLRSELGMHVVALGDQAARKALEALVRNEVVCLLSDRDLQASGVSVDFFGETTTVPAGPAVLAIRSGAPLLPTAVYFTERTDGHLGVVRPPVDTERRGRLRDDVGRVTQDLVVELEGLIRRAPQQWHLFQPNWPSDLAAARTSG